MHCFLLKSQKLKNNLYEILYTVGATKRIESQRSKRAVKNLAGESVLYPGVNYELDRQPFQVLSNLATSVFQPSPGLNQSKSPLINALARLQSSIAQPSDVNRVNGILLTDEEKGFYIDEWTDRNKLLNSLVTSKAFLSLPEGMQRDVLENHINSNKQELYYYAI